MAEEIIKTIKKIDLGNNTYGVFTVDKSILLDLCYPVGSIYISIKSEEDFNPTTAGWPGTGEKMDSNKFLLSGDGTDAGTLGGSDKIDLSQLPEHLHNTPYYCGKPNAMDNLRKGTAKGKLAVQADGHPVYYKFTSQSTQSAYSLNGIPMGGTERQGYSQVEVGQVGTSGGIYLEKDGNIVPAKLNQESYYPSYKKVTIGERIA